MIRKLQMMRINLLPDGNLLVNVNISNFEVEYNEFLLNKKKLEESGGTIKSQFGKMMETNLLSKSIQLGIVFHLLSNGRPMKDYPKMTK